MFAREMFESLFLVTELPDLLASAIQQFFAAYFQPAQSNCGCRGLHATNSRLVPTRRSSSLLQAPRTDVPRPELLAAFEEFSALSVLPRVGNHRSADLCRLLSVVFGDVEPVDFHIS